MSRYRGPKLKITRRLGTLPGLTTKKSNKINRPGKDGNANADTGKKLTEYGVRLEEKQKLKFNYGLSESQLFRYVKEARRRQGVTGLILLQLLEMRLDTLCFTLGFAKTMAQARQLVNHGHITVNKKVVNIPSFQCRLNDIISVKEQTSSKVLVENNLKDRQSNTIPAHLKFDQNKLEATVMDYCDRDDVILQLDELLVIEHYSRR
jgi:small subunit ribosomal protein S4|uniref:Small ribosomal subunit protein uS4c n=1 Tax=Fistulifera solaris TaxID=1519565 RepID=F3Y7G3_FISSO|nr:30S ribosomal protein S4 [Fistulifera solaris]BAK19008.1 30S ribosomal protein S4 [Fistulifera solaris]